MWFVLNVFVWLLLITTRPCWTEYSNVALGKPTSQINVEWYMGSNFAVDGNPELCAYTRHTLGSWWLVDLLSSHQIHHIAIANRIAVYNRLHDFYVYVSEKNPLPIASENGSFAGQVCFYYAGEYPANGTHIHFCEEILTGRYLFIYVPGYANPSICEFEVLAEKVPKKTFDAYIGSKSTLIPYFNTSSLSKMSCIAACMSSKDGEASIVQYEESTARCECIQRNQLQGGNNVISDSGWELFGDANN